MQLCVKCSSKIGVVLVFVFCLGCASAAFAVDTYVVPRTTSPTLTPPKVVSPIPRGINPQVAEAAKAPLPPVLIEPISVTIPLGTGVVFSWNPSIRAVGYSLKVSYTPDMASPVPGSPFQTDKTYHTLTSPTLQTGKTYYWQVGVKGITQTAPVYGTAAPASFTVAVPAAAQPPTGTSDLIVSECYFVPQSVVQGDAQYLQVKWKNIGAGSAVFPANCSYCWEWKTKPTSYTGDNAPGMYILSSGLTIPAGGGMTPSASTTETLSRMAPGTYKFRTMIDPDNKVYETNENNNTCDCQMTVLPRTKWPDLVITSLAVDPPNPVGTSPFKLIATVLNQGNDYAILIQGNPVVSADPYGGDGFVSNYTKLMPGQSMAFSITPKTAGALPGTRTWSVLIDRSKQVMESNRSNNTKTITFTVK